MAFIKLAAKRHQTVQNPLLGVIKEETSATIHIFRIEAVPNH